MLTSFAPNVASALCNPAAASPNCNVGDNCDKSAFGFFGLEPWYQYLPYKYDGVTKRCDIYFNAPPAGSNKTGTLENGSNSPILLIVLAVVDDLLRVAGIVAVVFVIVGGFKFITAGGEPEQIASAKQSITYAIIGLVVALIAVVIVSFIGNQLGVK